MTVQNVKLFLSQNTHSWISKIIMAVRRTPYSHVGFIINDTLTFEATGHGAEIRRWEHRYRGDPNMSYEVYQIKPAYQAALDRAVGELIDELVDTRYSYKQLIGFIWVWLCQKIGVQVRNPVQDGTGQVICTELNYLGLVRAAGYSKGLAKWFKTVTVDQDEETLGPDDVKEWLDKIWDEVAKEVVWKLVDQRGFDGTPSSWEKA